MGVFDLSNWLPTRTPGYQAIKDLEAGNDEEDAQFLLDGEEDRRSHPVSPRKTSELEVHEKAELQSLSDTNDEEQAPPTITTRLAQIPWKNVTYVGMNTAATVTITFLNKIVVQDEQLRSCQTSFAMYHFSCTFIALSIASLPPFRLFKRVRVPVLQIIPLCALFAGFLLLGNYSLQVNSIEFYTLAKMMTGPCIILLNFVLFQKTVSMMVLFSVTLLTGGVMLANGKFGLTHPLGAIIACAAFTVTAAYQIWIQKKMGDLKVSPSQLLFNQAPVAVLLLIFVVPFTDRVQNISHIKPQTWVALLGSGAVASVINITQFLIIGATSALTFNVIGIVKVVSILVLGWLIEGTWPSMLDVIGATIALGGAWLYASAASAAKTKVPEKVEEQEDSLHEEMQEDVHDSVLEDAIELKDVRDKP